MTAPPAQMSFSSSAKVVVGLAGLLLLGLLAVLVAVLFSLEGTRSELRSTRANVQSTDARVEKLTQGLDPLLATAAPLNDPATRRTARRLARGLSSAAGLIPGLAHDTNRSLAAAQGIAHEVEGAGLAQTLLAVRDLAPRASRLFAGLDVPGGSLSECDQRLSTLAPSQAGQLGCVLRTVPNLRALLKSVNTTLLKSRRIQRRTRMLTATGVDLFRQSLDIQREILARVRSLDDKLGGPLPSPTAAP